MPTHMMELVARAGHLDVVHWHARLIIVHRSEPLADDVQKSRRRDCGPPISSMIPMIGLNFVTIFSGKELVAESKELFGLFGGGKGQLRRMNLFQSEMPCKIPLVSGCTLASSRVEGGSR